MDPELFRLPGYLVNRAARLFNKWGDVHLQEAGLATAQLPVIGALKDGASMTQTELAKLVQIEQPTMAQLLARMERDRLVRRTPNPHDKRSRLVSLTPFAKKRLPAAREMLIEGNRKALHGFTDTEVETLVGLLRRLVDNLESPNA